MKNLKEEHYLVIMGLIGLIVAMVYKGYDNRNEPNEKMLKNTKYTVVKIISDFYGNRGVRNGYDYRFLYENGFKEGHIDGEFVFGRKYLVAYDSTNIRNGYIILDKFDVTDSLSKYHIEYTQGGYRDGWSLEKVPFQYDKSDIEYAVRTAVLGFQ